MYELTQAVLDGDTKIVLQQFLSSLFSSDKRYLLRNEILHAFAEYCHQSQKQPHFYHSSTVGKLIHSTHEILLEEDSIWLVIRARIGNQEFWRFAPDLSVLEQVSSQALLQARDRSVKRAQPQILEINFAPFDQNTPKMTDPRTIGHGLAFLNYYLSDRLLVEPDYWLDAIFSALHRLEFDNIPLLIGNRIVSGMHLYRQVQQAIKVVNHYAPDTPYAEFQAQLQELGFEPGWGNSASRTSETLELLNRLITAPEPAVLEAFVSRIPAVLRVVLVSIHGWVGQEYVGRPETMGQVIYVLEQARNLENQLQDEVKQAGLDALGIQPQVVILTRLIPNCEGTLCDLRLEKLEGTRNGWIMRVPFREHNPKVTQNWISKFEIHPYLEAFALDAESQLLAQLKGRPNLVIGHYSDGNLVAFLLSRRCNAIQCNIAHSLEKSKYLFSDLYWQDFEPHYHFSAQFTADLISMNAADFIITSSYQEIVGTPDALGQYESYKCFTMPQLYHVIDGIDLFGAKFNRVPPGVDEQIYFPYSQVEDRNTNTRARIQALLLGHEVTHCLGHLEDPSKCPLLTIGSVSLTNNLTGLVECFGRSQTLRKHCNLILVTNTLDQADASSSEEAWEVEQLHALIEQYQIQKQIRWIGMRLSRQELSEVYRVIADQQGVFVHFARFKSFGRTILEAMISGLPTFATEFGGASEIIEDGNNGFHINPTDLEETTHKLLNFIHQCDADPHFWRDISTQAIERVRRDYSWQSHIKQLLLFAKTYGFWNYIAHDREALRCYLDTLFYLLYKPRAEQILEQHMQR